jgi:hypothetical protein
LDEEGLLVIDTVPLKHHRERPRYLPIYYMLGLLAILFLFKTGE